MSINVNDKNLGHATAYAYYKAGGGTMTEAEFTEFMADFGTASQTAVEAAQAALASKNAAQTAATTATNKASEATTAATTATTKAAEAQADADAAALDASQALSAASTATTKATEATTAAATAVSAKDDAVSANTAAQSAKTAAQTAQTGAETAAASVEASAEQIATNAEDISQLKSELTDKADKLKKGTITNLLTNGDFHNASTGLMFYHATGSASNNVLTVIGDGTDTYIQLAYYFYITNLSANHYFSGVWVRVTDANCKKLKFSIAGGYEVIEIPYPVQNQWYYVANRYVRSNTGNAAHIWVLTTYYDDATLQGTGVIELKQATAFYLNSDFGLGIDPPLYQLMKIMEYNDFWMGSKNVTIWKADDPITEIPDQKQSFGQKHRPLITFVDDDGWQNFYDRLAPISEKYNVPMVTAMPIDSTVDDWCVLYLQDKLGWEVAAHPSDGNLANKETEAEIETVMTNTNDYLSERGFKWKNIVYANGEPDERVRRIAKKYYRCGAVGSTPRINSGVIANFEILRIPIGYPYTDDNEWNTFNNLKTFIDNAVSNNGWCVFMTHAGMTSYHTDNTDALIDQLIDYAINTCGIEVVTLNEGFNVFGNAVECGDYVGKNAYQSDDKTRGIAISQTGELGNIINVRTLNNLLSTVGTALGGTLTSTYDESTGAYTFTFSET
jgi:peptidoglycan/xylan/chitin deacetylase (PgdA/CDA1 family)